MPGRSAIQQAGILCSPVLAGKSPARDTGGWEMGWGICNDCVTGEPRFIQAIRHSSFRDLLQCFTECASDPREPGAHWTLSLQTAFHPYCKEKHSLQGSLHLRVSVNQCLSSWITSHMRSRFGSLSNEDGSTRGKEAFSQILCFTLPRNLWG